MPYLYDPTTADHAHKVSGKKALIKFMGTETPDDAQSAWDEMVTRVTAMTEFTADEGKYTIERLEQAINHYGHQAAAFRKSVANLFLSGQDEKATDAREKIDLFTEPITTLRDLKKTVEDRLFQAQTADAPTPTELEASGYDPAEYPIEEYKEDWWWNGETKMVYHDENLFNMVCPDCGCSGKSWNERCSCESEECGCSEDY